LGCAGVGSVPVMSGAGPPSTALSIHGKAWMVGLRPP
jgi:hypothetical protein